MHHGLKQKPNLKKLGAGAAAEVAAGQDGRLSNRLAGNVTVQALSDAFGGRGCIQLAVQDGKEGV